MYKKKIRKLFDKTDMNISTIHDLIHVCEITQDTVPFIICSLFFIEENIQQQRRWWTWPNIIINKDNKDYFTNFTEIKPRNLPNRLAWWVYNYLTQRSLTNNDESSSTPSSSSSTEAAPASSEDARSPWLSCSPCLDCFAPKPKARKRRHQAQKKTQERKRARSSPSLQINWEQAYCALHRENPDGAQWVKYTFTRQPTTGDGNCFFHAIIGSARSFGDQHLLNGYLRSVIYIRNNYFGNLQDTNQERKAHLSTMGEWINTDDIQYIAQTLGICIFLYGRYGHNSHGWRIFNGEHVSADNVVYIYNNGQATSGNTSGTHFETLRRGAEQDFECNNS